MLKPFLSLVLGLAAVALVTAFALLNRTPVAIWLFGWRWWLPLVWVILGSFALGVGVGAGLSLRRQFYLAQRLRDVRLESMATVLEPQFAATEASSSVAEAVGPTTVPVAAAPPQRELLVTLHE